jgi:SAM-dependent methyltransferase
MKCPICRNRKFRDFRERANARCTNCQSLERGRYLWLVLNKMGILQPGIRVLHMAPEKFLLKPLKELCGEYYHPCDIDPERYKNEIVDIYHLDLCEDIDKLPSNCFDLIIHNHVLEHIPCSVEATLKSLTRVMKSGGHQFFTVPFGEDFTKEDLAPNLSYEERKKQFGQEDHLRIFGRKDFPIMLKRIFNSDNVIIEPAKIVQKEEILEAAIPTKIFNNIDANTIFYFQKR